MYQALKDFQVKEQGRANGPGSEASFVLNVQEVPDDRLWSMLIALVLLVMDERDGGRTTRVPLPLCCMTPRQAQLLRSLTHLYGLWGGPTGTPGYVVPLQQLKQVSIPKHIAIYTTPACAGLSVRWDPRLLSHRVR